MKLEDIFTNPKPIIGMIHLAGNNPVKRGMRELEIYEEEGVDGAIIEDYHGEIDDVYALLRESQGKFPNLIRGVNVLKNPYASFVFAQESGARFVQFDSVQTPDLKLQEYDLLRKEFPEIVVLGGVGFKGTPPTGNPLNVDLRDGKSRCEAIVTTGSGTGIETPLEKLSQYKSLLENFPLFVGAGVNLQNVYEQLSIADGAIIGSYFKRESHTRNPLERKRISELMKVVNEMRNKL